MEVTEYLAGERKRWPYATRLPFDERYWTPGVRTPTLLPARVTADTTLVGVNGGVFFGVGAGDRIYVVAVQHRALKSKRLNIVCVHPEQPLVLFHIRRSRYAIG